MSPTRLLIAGALLAGCAAVVLLQHNDRPRLAIEVQANVFTASDQGNAAVDVEASGRMLVVWDSRRQERGSPGIYARYLDPVGRPLSAELHVNQFVHGMQVRPDVALLADGSAWFVWESHGQDGDGAAVVARRFAPDMRPAGAELPVNFSQEGDQGQAVVAAASGAALAAWSTTIPGERSRSAIRVRVLDYETATAEIDISTPADGTDGLPALTSVGEDGFLIVWARRKSTSTPHGIYGRRLAADGTPVGDEFLVSPARPGQVSHIEPAVAGDRSGRAAVAWLSSAPGGYAVNLRRFDTDLQPIEAPRQLAWPENGWKSGVAVAASGRGEFLLSYNSDGEDGDGQGVFARVLPAAGNLPATPPMRVNQHWSGMQQATVASGASRAIWSERDQLVFAWHGDAGLGDASAANLTLLVPDDLLAAPASAGIASAVLAPAGTSEVQTANPPIWNPDFKPKARRGAEVASGGDFGFEAIPGTPWVPPDPELAVGLDQILVMSNGAIVAFDKLGNFQWSDEIEDSFGFWGEFGTDNFVFDPEVTWDPHAQRFLAMAIERSDNSRSNFLLAVSRDAHPDDRDDWYKYSLDVTGEAGNDIDSPNLALSTDYVLLTADFFGPDKYLILVIDKDSVLSGGAPVASSELISGFQQQSMGIPVVYSDNSTLYIVQSTENASNDEVILHAITDPIDNYQRQTLTLIVPEYTFPAAPPQKDSAVRPTLFEPRFWSVAERNDSIWAVHHVNNQRARVRWYEFELNGWPGGGMPAVAQVGELDLGGDIYTYFPSIHVDAADNAAITFARSASNEYISMGRALRGAGDPANQFRPVQVVQISENPHTSGRWGDYSGTQADPAASDTFWGHHEFTIAGNFDWRTWVARYDLRSAPLLLDADSLVAGQTVELRATGASAGATVYFVGSGAGTGITDLPPLGTVISLQSPRLLGTDVADGSGNAEVTVAIPGGAAGRRVWLQALEAGLTSNWIETVIQ